jgi:SAM-dependent methyltransferase
VTSLAKHFRLRPGVKFLDAGCGFGYAMRTWGRYCMPGGKLVGLDRDKKLLAQAARFCRKEGLGKAVQFATGDICAMPLPDNEFDMSLSHVVFCHLAEQQKALDEMIRVTRPGGCIAVFDNAVAAGGHNLWQNWHEPSVRERLLQYEASLRWIAGRKKLGFGDFSVGCYLPGWMEQRGLRYVGARTNENVNWMAPPYRSSEQQVTLQNTRERMKASRRTQVMSKAERDQFYAGGLSETKVDLLRRQHLAANRMFRKAMRNGSAALSSSASFWCVWGFKP